jgi:hypothetical protein
MGSPLASSEDVRAVIEAISTRNVEWLNTLYDTNKPNPSHLMFACASVLGEGGQEHIAGLMRKVPAKQRRSKFVDLCIQLATAEDAVPTPKEAVVEVPAEAVAVEAPKKRRRRRTKSQIEADQAADSAGEDPTPRGEPSEVLELDKLVAIIVEGNKAVFELQQEINSLSSSVVDIQKNLGTLRNQVHMTTSLTYTALSAIKDALSAAELELVMNGKLGTASITDTLSESWPEVDLGDDPTPF